MMERKRESKWKRIGKEEKYKVGKGAETGLGREEERKKLSVHRVTIEKEQHKIESAAIAGCVVNTYTHTNTTPPGKLLQFYCLK